MLANILREIPQCHSLFSGRSPDLTIFRGHSRQAVEYFHVCSTQYTREKSIRHWRIGLDIPDNL